MASAAATGRTVARQRRLQEEIDRKDAKAKPEPEKKRKKPVQAGARDQPARVPAQHVRKPGRESQLQPAPRFTAPGYAGSGKLDGMAAIVTGADSGIGRAVAVLFAREGADVAILYLSEDGDAKETARHVENEGREALLVRGDVRDSAFCKRAAARVARRFGKIDVLVNNAGFQLHADRLEDITDEHFDETLRTNLYGYFHMTRAASPHLGSGCSIINTGSETGLFGSGGLLDYSMTKGGIHAFTMALASNMVKRGIRVNAVAPGPVWTPLNPADQSAEKVSEFGKSSPMGRPAQPEELAPAYVFLAAPSCASYISGAILPVMGGPTG
jgi:NAD(P)-dependent dehydrogenase (short-subunit alcohol dehydrogenase family)